MTSKIQSKSSLYQKLREHSETIQHDPMTNSVFRLAQEVFFELSSGDISFDDLTTSVSDIDSDLFKARAIHLAEQHELDRSDIWSASGDQLETLAENGFDTFRSRVESRKGGIVFTAHPTFAHSRGERLELAELASTGSSDQTEFSEANGISLAEEHDEAQDAIMHAQESQLRYLKRVYHAAAKSFPEDWMSLQPTAPTIASWVTYDLDGRNDINWWTSLSYRLSEKADQLNRYLENLQAINVTSDAIPQLESELKSAAELARAQADAFATDLTNPENLVAAANSLTANNLARLTTLRQIIATLRDVAITQAIDTSIDLLSLASQMELLGLGTARIHLRINAAQIQTVIRRDLGLATEDHEMGRTALDILSSKIVSKETVDINFSDVYLEQSTAIRQMMFCAQILKHIDEDTPIRFLIAESENPATVLGALYLASRYGVADKLDISPLFETPEALANGGRFIERLLKVSPFREYVKTRNQLSIQLGFSDAGRFIGQISADMAIERIQVLIARTLANDLPGLPVLFFNTHGESVGRGAYPGGFDKRLEHCLSRWVISKANSLNVPILHEVSFQGGDGYLHFATQTLSDSVYDAFASNTLRPADTIVDDPFYSETNLVWDFYRSLRNWHENLFDEPDYAFLLSDFAGGFMPTTGSRPKRRAGGPKGPRSLRAILHNAILQQLGALANTACGIGSSLRREADDIADLINRSPRFRALIDLASFSRAKTSIPALRGYAAVYSPAFWVASSKRKDDVRQNARASVARLLEEGTTFFAIMKMANKFSLDLSRFDRLTQKLNDPPSIEQRHEDRLPIHALHALRQGIMLRALEIAGGLPAVSARHGFSVSDVQDLIIQMRLDEAIERLEQIFPVAAHEITAFASLAETRSGASDLSPKDYTALHDELIRPLNEISALNKKITLALCHAYYAFG